MTVAVDSVTEVAYPYGHGTAFNDLRGSIADVVLSDFDDGVALTASAFGLAEIKGVAVLGVSGVNDAGVRVALQYNQVDGKLYPVGAAGSTWNACPVTARLLVVGL